MKTFLINLKRRPDRLAEMATQFNAIGLDFERIEAVDGKQVDNSTEYFSPKRFFLENRRHYVPGEVGCALSHINIWRRMIADNLDYALVLEDDVIISENIKDLLKSDIYKHFDYLKIDFEMSDDGINDIINNTKTDSTTLTKMSYHHSGAVAATYKIFRVIRDHSFIACECDPVPYSTCGYIISRHGAERFLKISKNMYYPIDLLPRYASALVREGFTTSALVQYTVEDSDISGRAFGEPLSASDAIVFIFHKIFNRRRRRQFLTKPILINLLKKISSKTV